MTRPRHLISAGAFLGLLSVLLGAMGSHALSKVISERAMESFKTGVQYQFFHALALIAIGIWAEKNELLPRGIWAGRFILLGTALFSWSLFVYAVFDIQWVVLITPIGGLSLMIGWLLFAGAAWPKQN